MFCFGPEEFWVGLHVFLECLAIHDAYVLNVYFNGSNGERSSATRTVNVDMREGFFVEEDGSVLNELFGNCFADNRKDEGQD